MSLTYIFCWASFTYVILQPLGLLSLALAHHSVSHRASPRCMGNVSGQWLMQHVEPCETTALCPCVRLPGGLQYCRSMPYEPFPCSLSEQTCKQLRFPSEVVSGVFFFLTGGEGSDRIRGIGEAGLQIKVRCASYAAVRSMHTFISNKVLNNAD